MSKAHSSPLEELQRRLDYRFRDPALLQRALTHRSHSRSNNERLEFLGDGLINFVVAAELYSRFPTAREGELSRLRAQLVKGDSLAAVARELDLGTFLRLGSGERKSGGAGRTSILADALEAVIGALYLDAGEARTRELVLSWLAGRLATIDLEEPSKDPKTRLQEWLQARGRELPEYRVVEIRGEAHEQEFEVSCHVGGLVEPGSGRGRSRRLAEQRAAAETLERLEENGSGA